MLGGTQKTVLHFKLFHKVRYPFHMSVMAL